MKTWILTIVALLTSVVTVAQRREGTCTVQPKVGLNVSTLSDAQKTIGDACFGMEAEYMITNIFSLKTLEKDFMLRQIRHMQTGLL